jgi:hypothetical protein
MVIYSRETKKEQRPRCTEALHLLSDMSKSKGFFEMEMPGLEKCQGKIVVLLLSLAVIFQLFTIGQPV